MDQTQQAKVAVDSMTRTLRTAVLPSQLNGPAQPATRRPSSRAPRTRSQFYANINNDSNAIGPSRVSYVVNANGELVETIQPPNAHAANDYNYTYCTPGPGCVVSTRVLARGVPTGLAVFTYYDHAGNVMTASTLSSTDLAQVDSIDVVVQVKSAPGVTPPATTMVTRVTLPNADAIAQASPSP